LLNRDDGVPLRPLRRLTLVARRGANGPTVRRLRGLGGGDGTSPSSGSLFLRGSAQPRRRRAALSTSPVWRLVPCPAACVQFAGFDGWSLQLTWRRPFRAAARCWAEAGSA